MTDDETRIYLILKYGSLATALTAYAYRYFENTIDRQDWRIIRDYLGRCDDR